MTDGENGGLIGVWIAQTLTLCSRVKLSDPPPKLDKMMRAGKWRRRREEASIGNESRFLT